MNLGVKSMKCDFIPIASGVLKDNKVLEPVADSLASIPGPSVAIGSVNISIANPVLCIAFS